MRTRDIKINRLVYFNTSFKKTNTINPLYANEEFKIIETTSLTTGILVHVRSTKFPKVAMWVSSSHVDVTPAVASVPSTTDEPKQPKQQKQPPVKTPLSTDLAVGDIVKFNDRYKQQLREYFRVPENFDHIRENKHIVKDVKRFDDLKYPQGDRIQINCWTMPAIWFTKG